MQHIAVRSGTGEDIDFLREMLYEAVYWRPGGERRPLEVGLAVPESARSLRIGGSEQGTGR